MNGPRVIRAVTARPTPRPCECLCATWGHLDCTGNGCWALTITRNGRTKTLRMCPPCSSDIADRIPTSARRVA